MDPIPDKADIIRNLIICGLGLSLGNAIIIIVQNAMPQSIMGVVSAGNQFARVIGGTVMLTVLGAVMTSSVTRELAARLPADSAARSVDPDALIAHTVHVSDADATVVQEALGRAIPDVFYVVLPLIAISFAAAFLVERRSLRDTVDDDDGGEAAPRTVAEIVPATKA
jgi:hypothetical protein